jgi:hypothetical protein
MDLMDWSAWDRVLGSGPRVAANDDEPGFGRGVAPVRAVRRR